MGKNIIITLLVLGLITFLANSWTGSSNNSFPVFFDKNGQLTSSQVKVWADTVTPTTASAFAIDISSAGFSNIKSIDVVAQNNTTTVGSMPRAVVKSCSTTSLVVNLLTENTSTVTILGISVLSGAPLVAAPSLTGIILNVKIIGN